MSFTAASALIAHEDSDFNLSTLTEQNVNDRRLIMRRAILIRGIPRSLTFTRGDIWKLLLGVTACDADRYLALVAKGESEYHEIIKHDASRTFRVSHLFGVFCFVFIDEITFFFFQKKGSWQTTCSRRIDIENIKCIDT